MEKLTNKNSDNNTDKIIKILFIKDIFKLKNFYKNQSNNKKIKFR